MRERFYRRAPHVLGAAGALLGIGCFALDAVFYTGVGWLLWTLTSVLLAAAGVALGLLLKRLDALANIDPFRNRRYAKLKVNGGLKRTNLLLTIAMVDVDKFKAANEEFADLSKDALLEDLSDLIRQTVRQTDTVVRWGEDEFLVVFPRTGRGEALIISERIRKAAEERYGEEELALSIGVTAVPFEIDATQALRKADYVLYKAKGSNNVMVSVPMEGGPLKSGY